MSIEQKFADLLGVDVNDFKSQGDNAERINELEEENTRLNDMLNALLEGRQE